MSDPNIEKEKIMLVMEYLLAGGMMYRDDMDIILVKPEDNIDECTIYAPCKINYAEDGKTTESLQMVDMSLATFMNDAITMPDDMMDKFRGKILALREGRYPKESQDGSK